MKMALGLYLVVVIATGLLLTIIIHAKIKLLIKYAGVFIGVALLIISFFGVLDVLGLCKPTSVEWRRRHTKEATVLASKIEEEVAIYLWLEIPGELEPLNYKIPWDMKKAIQLQKAVEKVKKRGGSVKMKLPFENNNGNYGSEGGDGEPGHERSGGGDQDGQGGDQTSPDGPHGERGHDGSENGAHHDHSDEDYNPNVFYATPPPEPPSKR